MCGIIGYKGGRNANEVVLKGLQELEYRGYDSWGIASRNSQLQLVKEVGRISAVTLAALNLKDSSEAIGHTRWSTHGSVTKINAHPHSSQKGDFMLVQNGIVENFQELKQQLQQQGYPFYSQTDSEVIVRLIEEQQKDTALLSEAVGKAFLLLKGRNAVSVLSADGTIIAVRQGSPLLLGFGEEEYFIASDASPILEYTTSLLFLNDLELVVLQEKPSIIHLPTGQPITRNPEVVSWTREQAKKNHYPHFMLKEILEQKHTLTAALTQDPALIQTIATAINDAFGVYMVGCGTAGKVCLTGTYAFSAIAKKHVNFAFGSEFANYHHFLKEKSLLVAVSQSGETADTLEAINTLRQKGGTIISLVNVMGSTIVRQSDYSLLLHAGPEIAVCSTKATTSQLALLILLAYACAKRYEEGHQLLAQTSSAVNNMLTEEFCSQIQLLAARIQHHENMYIIGRGINYPMALEAAIKIQEVSYIHAEGFAGGELKHGPIALITADTPVVVFVANDETKDDILSNAMEIKSRGGHIIGVSPFHSDIFDVWIAVPDVGIASPIVNIIPIQLLAYYLAVARGCDPDKPRNLAKSVTVK